jgi:hypothetical protein
MLRVVALVATLVGSASAAHAMPDPPIPGDEDRTPSEPIHPLQPDPPPPPDALPPPAMATRPVYVPVYGPLPGAQPVATPREREYGWKIALSDGVALGLVLLAVSIETPDRHETDYSGLSGSDALALLGIGWWSTVTPLVHLSESNGSSAVRSYALRLALPLAGVLVGHTFDNPDSLDASGALAGMCIGALAASVIDITLLSHRTERGSGWMPTFGASSGGFRIGVGRAL